jgi:hypothetical protein
LYACKTWSFTLREDHRLRLFGNRVLRKIFGSMWVELKADWRKLHNEELYYLYSSLDFVHVIKTSGMRWVRYVAYMGEKIHRYKPCFWRPEAKRLL